MNPLVPDLLDVVLATAATIVAVSAFAAFLSLSFAKRVSVRRFLVWAAVILFIPVAGAALWFAIGRPQHRSTAVAEP
ncbi:PLDc N-terminal domain-containing protein [Microbacterium resistens]|uniref:PLDc N-terminal domain-containing protein n=1 Tax=Microbacterium resistens TaxID=156977 RepID=A0ABY3RPD7_9MICO|nr:PLDc N-terminal domain-containing protein [Microbacterium resistens]UGS25769.1 PLDc N-terminal domain-containing protein [Microbacterium resistens]